MLARFPVLARLDSSRPVAGTVIIDRMRGLFMVRPYRRRRTYDLPLSVVADMVVGRVIRAEVVERRKRKKGA